MEQHVTLSSLLWWEPLGKSWLMVFSLWSVDSSARLSMGAIYQMIHSGASWESLKCCAVTRRESATL